MFRPFLPCGFAYGFAYALPMALPMAFHALFPAEGIPPGCLYCTISARCLSTGFGRISAAFAFFRRRGGAPVSGGLLRRWRCPAGGACFLCCLPTLPLVFDFAPYPPSPLPRRGRGRLKVYFAGGFAPGTPALNRLRHLQTLPEQVHGAGTCLLCCLPTLPLVFVFAPYPPSPLPRRGRGLGGWGQQSKLKAGAAGDKQGKPPLRIPERQGQPTTSRASPPITPAPHMPPAGRRQCGQNPAGRRDSRRTRARPRRRKWHAERYREHG